MRWLIAFALLVAAPSAAQDSPRAYAFSPIVGYDVASGLMLGGAAFVFPRQGDAGLDGGLQFQIAPFNGAGAAVNIGVAARHLWGDFWPLARGSFVSLPGRYYGLGMATSADLYVASSPRRFDGALGIAWAPAAAFEVTVEWLGADQRDVSRAFLDAAAAQEGLVEGGYTGGRVQLLNDTRDRRVAPASGHLASVWAEEWLVQAGQSSSRTRVGASATQLFPLGTNRVLALHAEGAWAGGDRAYLTSFQLGGAELLRGYAPGRFRGDAMIAAGAELRRSLFSALSMALFAEAGRVWAGGAPPGTVLAADAGASLRWGLPPDRLMKIRLDFARGRDSFSTYVAFGDPF